MFIILSLLYFTLFNSSILYGLSQLLMPVLLIMKTNDTSELCIWDGKSLEMDPTAQGSQPIATVHAPHRIPYGVHGLFLTPDQLATQWAAIKK